MTEQEKRKAFYEKYRANPRMLFVSKDFFDRIPEKDVETTAQISHRNNGDSFPSAGETEKRKKGDDEAQL